MSICLGDEILYESPEREWSWDIETSQEPITTAGDYMRVLAQQYLPSIREMLNAPSPLMRTMQQRGTPIRDITRTTVPFWRTQPQEAAGRLTADLLRQIAEDCE